MKIKLRFTTSKSWISNVIRLMTWSDFSHVEFLVDDETPRQFSHGCEGYLGSLGHGGVLLRPLDYDTPQRQVLATTVDLPTEMAFAVWSFAFRQIGKPYDVGAILAMPWRQDWKQPDSWFCSEMVAAAFDAGGFPLLNDWGKLNRVTPRDLLMSTRLNFQ